MAAQFRDPASARRAMNSEQVLEQRSREPVDVTAAAGNCHRRAADSHQAVQRQERARAGAGEKRRAGEEVGKQTGRRAQEDCEHGAAGDCEHGSARA
eukprot:748683-Hanusia_phi.AAC.1